METYNSPLIKFKSINLPFKKQSSFLSQLVYTLAHSLFKAQCTTNHPHHFPPSNHQIPHYRYIALVIGIIILKVHYFTFPCHFCWNQFSLKKRLEFFHDNFEMGFLVWARSLRCAGLEAPIESLISLDLTNGGQFWSFPLGWSLPKG